MTRERAVAVAQALDAIDSFEVLADQIMHVIQMNGDIPGIDAFEYELGQFLEAELQRRREVLEKL